MANTLRREIADEAAQVLERNSELQVKFFPPESNQKLPPKVDGCFLINDQIKIPLEVRLNLRKRQVKLLQDRMQSFPSWMLISDYFTRPMQEYLRENQIFFLDTAGNSFLRLPNITVSIKGEPKPEARATNSQKQLTQTQVRALYDLLLHPDWLHLSYRQLEQRLGIAKSTIHKLFTVMTEDGFLDEGQDNIRKWRQKKALAEFWTQAYGVQLRKNSLIARCRFSTKTGLHNWKNWEMTHQTKWGGEPAAELLTNELVPGEWILYTSEALVDLQMRYRIIPDSEGPIIVYKQFWQEDPPLPNRPQPTVSPLLVYADLMLSAKARSMQLASNILTQHVDNTSR